MALENRRLDIIAAGQVTRQMVLLAANENFGALLPADVEVGEDLLQLFRRGLRADHCCRIERVALNDGGNALQRLLHEFVVDLFVHK